MVDISSIIVKFNKLVLTVDQWEVEFSTKLKLRCYIILTISGKMERHTNTHNYTLLTLKSSEEY
jgi:hypothetical protein